MLGTLACLSDSERSRIEGIVINRFRGEVGLLEPGIEWLERECGKRVLGVLPYLNGLVLDAEDALPEKGSGPFSAEKGPDPFFRVAVPVYPAPAACAALLDWAGMRSARGVDLAAMREASLERLADWLEEHLETGFVMNAVARRPLP